MALLAGPHHLQSGSSPLRGITERPNHRRSQQRETMRHSVAPSPPTPNLDKVDSGSLIYLIRNTFRLSSRQHWDALKHYLKPIYTAPTEAAASAAFDDLADRWGKQYPAIIRLWNNAWQEFIPFLDYDTEIRRVLCSTNAIESLNARYRRAVKARGHFPTEAAALKCLYLVTRSLDPTGKGQARWITRWKPALNAFAITFADRWPGSETY